MKNLREYINLVEGLASGRKAPVKTHTSDCNYNSGHDCNCKGVLTHADDCNYNYGHECDCGLR